MRVLLVVLLIVLCAPVKLGAAFMWRQGSGIRVAAGVMVWGLRFQTVRRLGAFQAAETGEKELPMSGEVVRKVKTAVLHSRWGKEWFFRSATLEKLYLVGRFGIQDAAVCALTDALLQSTAGIFHRYMPKVRILIRAVCGNGGHAFGRCIVRIRLGNLLVILLLGVLSFAAESIKNREEKTWSSIPSKT